MPHGTLPPDAPVHFSHEIDRRVARRLSVRRLALRLTPETLDAALTLPEGSVAAYEAGARPIAAAILCRVAMLLKIEIDGLFAEVHPDDDLAGGSESAAGTEMPSASEMRAVLAVGAGVTDPALRSDLVALVLSLADSMQPRHGAIDRDPTTRDD